jgi:hypothetical protein
MSGNNNPIRSGSQVSTGQPISSQQVVWNGPNIPLLQIKKGEKIDSTIYKAAMVMTEIISEVDLSTVDVKDLLKVCATCPNPTKNVKTILSALIGKVYLIEELIESLDRQVDGEEVLIRVAACFRTEDDGVPITQLKHSDYTKAIGLQVCEILAAVKGYENVIDQIENDVSELKLRVSALEETDDAIIELESRIEVLEKYRTALTQTLGSINEIASILQSELKESEVGGAIRSLVTGEALWAGDSTTASLSIKRLWQLAIDVRSAVKLIQENCCKVTCDDIVIDFDVRLNDDRTQMTIFFATKTILPGGFKDNDALGNKLTIMDALGNKYVERIKVAEEVNNPNGYVIDLSNTPIDPNQDYYLSMDAAVTSDRMTCVKCITKSITYKSTCGYCEIFVKAMTGAAPGNLILSYRRVSDPTIKTAVVKTGDSLIIPKDIIIIQAIRDGDISIESPCEGIELQLNNAVGGVREEYVLSLEFADSQAKGDFVTGIGYNGTFYPLTTPLDILAEFKTNASLPHGMSKLFEFIQSAISGGRDLLLLKEYTLDTWAGGGGTGQDDQYMNAVVFKTFAAIINNGLYVQVEGKPGGDSYNTAYHERGIRTVQIRPFKLLPPE